MKVDTLSGSVQLACPCCTFEHEVPARTEIGEIFICPEPPCYAPVVLSRDGSRAVLRLLQQHEIELLDLSDLSTRSALSRSRLRLDGKRRTFRIVDTPILSDHWLMVRP